VSVNFLANHASTANDRSHLTAARADHGSGWPVPRRSAHGETVFAPGESAIPVSGKIFDAVEMQHLVDASLDFWLTTGRFAGRFEREFARWTGVRECVLTNSGSSANLLAVSALTSTQLGDRRLVPGDEVITVAAGFPTTVHPILQNNLVPSSST
jgi:CDP-6-deoxy-D-xylo-4-hexulose-3-dehydrase